MTEHLIDGPACWETCRACGATVLAALEGGSTARVDVVPIRDLIEELGAQLGGRRTFDVIRIGTRTELILRDQWRIRHRKHPVLPEHWCATQGAGSIPVTPAPKKTRRPTNTAATRHPLPPEGTPPF